jgi:hypothetical protein
VEVGLQEKKGGRGFGPRELLGRGLEKEKEEEEEKRGVWVLESFLLFFKPFQTHFSNF